MTGLNSLTNFYCPQISSPVSHEINLSLHQINYCLFKNERVDEAKSAQMASAFFFPLSSVSGFFNPELCLTLPNTKSLLPALLIDRQTKQQRVTKGLSLLLKNCEDNQAGRKETLKDEQAVMLAGWADEMTSNSLEQ